MAMMGRMKAMGGLRQVGNGKDWGEERSAIVGKVESGDKMVAKMGRTKVAAWEARGGGIVGCDGEGKAIRQ